MVVLRVNYELDPIVLCVGIIELVNDWPLKEVGSWLWDMGWLNPWLWMRMRSEIFFSFFFFFEGGSLGGGDTYKSISNGGGKWHDCHFGPPPPNLPLRAVQGEGQKQGQNAPAYGGGVFLPICEGERVEVQKWEGKLADCEQCFWTRILYFFNCKKGIPSLYPSPLEFYTFTPPNFALCTGPKQFLPPHFTLYPWSWCLKSIHLRKDIPNVNSQVTTRVRNVKQFNNNLILNCRKKIWLSFDLILNCSFNLMLNCRK